MMRLGFNMFKPFRQHLTYFSNNLSNKKGLVLGVYTEEGKPFKLTAAAEYYNKVSNGQLVKHIELVGGNIKQGKSYVFWGLDNTFQSVAVVGLGKEKKGFHRTELMDQDKETIRTAAASGCEALNSMGIHDITFESFGDAETSAEGSLLSSWKFQGVRTKKDPLPTVNLLEVPGLQEQSLWYLGSIKAQSQNFARFLSDTPSNLMTPSIFCQNVEEALKNLNIKIEIHDKKWAEELGMGSFLSVNKGSDEPPKFLELTYTNAVDKPMVLIGKGVTFDAGGISLKPATCMDEMRGDMGGAACVVATLQAVAAMKLEANLKVLVPLVENMPSGSATKPGDVVRAMNGKTICVDNTDAEGRLILADALVYSKRFVPKWILDVATLTGAMRVALGNAAAGVFTNSDELYRLLQEAGAKTGDRVWRFPLWDHYSTQITKYDAFDVNNVGKAKGGGSCTAAAFLKEFVPENTDWIHMDIAGVMGPDCGVKYLPKGMSGRPTRTLIEFIRSQVKK
ncbi:cytosol aminopeptidase-like isoform X2 [Onthophagus taurus]|uniref:cytosol aminopeptidase-like isoform X2 n=1 Tax=Onthophagus taurus TaxID=166361 RepID=UPI000C20459D|nr:cytosol aminopeptidase-like isoform X2 [Onthophagus taurus]